MSRPFGSACTSSGSVQQLYDEFIQYYAKALSMGWMSLQVAYSSYVWLPLLPREDGLGYALLDLEQWRPRDFMAQASYIACPLKVCWNL